MEIKTTVYLFNLKNFVNINMILIKVSIWQNKIFGFCISRMHTVEEYFKRFFDSVTFLPQNWALKFPRWPCATKMSGSCKVWIQNRRSRHFRNRLLSPPVYFNVSLYFHKNSIIFRIIYVNKWLILYGKTMKYWNEELTIPEVTSWHVLDPDIPTPGHLR